MPPVKKNQPAAFYPAKLLLFGEHLLLNGAPALAAPVPAFSGRWAWGNNLESVREKQQRLMEFAGDMTLLSIGGMDTDAFKRDLEQGLFFESNIPSGYGLGSSGALCAAIYDRYMALKTNDLSDLKSLFAGMENFFHGNSSGIDPLTSYVGKPLLIRDKTEVSVANEPVWEQAPVVCLIDSGLPRRTGPLVQWFLEQSRQSDFANLLETSLLPAHAVMLGAWLRAEPGIFWPMLRQVSAFQFEHFIPMIPATLRSLWADCLEKNDLVLKICGAGGGGFTLGFARNREAVEQITDRYPVFYPFD